MAFTQDYTTCLIPVWKKHLMGFRGKPCQFLEIGVYEGRSTIWFIENILTHDDSHYTGVDSFEGGIDQQENGVECKDIYERYLDNTKPYRGEMCIMSRYSNEVMEDLIGWKYKFDIIYVDASHVATDVKRDLELAWKLLNKGGLLIADDYSWTIDKVVERRPKAAIDEWMAEHKGEYKLLYLDMQMIVEKEV